MTPFYDNFFELLRDRFRAIRVLGSFLAIDRLRGAVIALRREQADQVRIERVA